MTWPFEETVVFIANSKIWSYTPRFKTPGHDGPYIITRNANLTLNPDAGITASNARVS